MCTNGSCPSGLKGHMSHSGKAHPAANKMQGKGKSGLPKSANHKQMMPKSK